MKLKVHCECKKKFDGTFICSVQPNEEGTYTWLLVIKEGTFGGTSSTQLVAMEEANRILLSYEKEN